VTEEEFAESRREVCEDHLVREGKALCGGCDEGVHFNHKAKLWVDDNDRHNCRGTTNQHKPREAFATKAS
jgi:hypothetical protein